MRRRLTSRLLLGLLVPLFAFIAVPITVPSHGSVLQQFVDRTTDFYDLKRDFFELSGFGALAIMPNVTSDSEKANEFEYITFGMSGKYRIARGRMRSPADWWFIVNHRRGSGASTRYSYIGVFVAKRLAQPLSRQLHLHRNDGWTTREGTELGDFDDTYTSWRRFLELQGDNGTEEAFGREFGDWHAISDTPSGEYSWVDRNSWSNDRRVEECFSAIGGGLGGADVMFQAHLIRFRVTESSNSRAPVAWQTGLRNADALYVKTFSPEAGDLTGEYCIEISN